MINKIINRNIVQTYKFQNFGNYYGVIIRVLIFRWFFITFEYIKEENDSFFYDALETSLNISKKLVKNNS